MADPDAPVDDDAALALEAALLDAPGDTGPIEQDGPQPDPPTDEELAARAEQLDEPAPVEDVR